MELDIAAQSLQTRFEEQGKIKDIEDAIELFREALHLRAPPDPDRGASLNKLANGLYHRFMQQGDSSDINEAVELHREALALDGPPHAGWGRLLNNLANIITTRFERQGDGKDLDEAIALHREALALRAPPHPDRGISLNNLAKVVLTRFEQRGDSKDIDEFIELNKEALALCEPPHRARANALNNLANAVQRRAEQRGDSRDIDEAIEVHREALALLPPPHPNRGAVLNSLADTIRTRFEQHRDSKDIDEAIEIHREALALYPPPHPNRPTALTALALSLTAMYAHSKNPGDLDQACALFKEAATYAWSSPYTRFHQACFWARNAARYAHISALAAYRTAFMLLPKAIPLHRNLTSRQEILLAIQPTTLPSEAATCAVNFSQFHTAVEFLEASRSVFWSQALQLRMPLDGLAEIAPDLDRRLAVLSRELEKVSFRDTSRNLFTDTQHQVISVESEGIRCHQLNEAWEEVIKSVQMLPGFQDFMQPKSINALKQAAISGPIIVLATSDSTCFALIVTTKEVQCLRLPTLTLAGVELLANLCRDLLSPAFDLDTFVAKNEHGNHPKNQSELVVQLFGAQEGSINVDPNNVFQALLAVLWKTIVKPVLDALNFQISTDPPRLWWCPIGPFAFVPLHAAGIYGTAITDCASDYVVSSYTPTLTALLDRPVETSTLFKMTAVIQPQAPNCSPLPGAREELNKIAERVPNRWLTALGDTTPATVKSALIHLWESQIIHFACHGTQDLEHPLDSGLILSDGCLTISEAMRRPEGDNVLNVHKCMSLAFLNADETAKGDKNIPDEAMHLAATMLFAGFRGVVATMGAISDLDRPKIVDTFYEHLFKSCDPPSSPPVLPDLRQAAKALHLAIAKLREEPDIPFRRWVPFVHYGL
ncbi:CHAT domain-containing protein [Mycena galopus ATCC 62051]|nr:CHAT domain-containing protein [Mycena galopus ATCC 62051]